MQLGMNWLGLPYSVGELRDDEYAVLFIGHKIIERGDSKEIIQVLATRLNKAFKIGLYMFADIDRTTKG